MSGRLIIDIKGLSLTEEEAFVLKSPAVAGVILFARNYQSPDQLASLVTVMRQLREELLICVDQEGGRVQRFGDPLTRLPAVGLLRRGYQENREKALQDAENLGWLMASEILSLGVDLSFAPVLDIDYHNNKVIADRAFGVTVEEVIHLAQAYIAGMHRAGMAAVGKHFPGHGFVSADSHEDLPLDVRPLEALAQDFRPFEVLGAQMEGIMTAHVVYNQVDSAPASFSRAWLHQTLRQQLGYRGLIISDDLNMKGAWGEGRPQERAVKALDAGCDLLLYCNDDEGALALVDFLESSLLNLHSDTATLRRAGSPHWSTFVTDQQREQVLASIGPLLAS